MIMWRCRISIKQRISSLRVQSFLFDNLLIYRAEYIVICHQNGKLEGDVMASNNSLDNKAIGYKCFNYPRILLYQLPSKWNHLRKQHMLGTCIILMQYMQLSKKMKHLMQKYLGSKSHMPHMHVVPSHWKSMFSIIVSEVVNTNWKELFNKYWGRRNYSKENRYLV